MDGVSVIIPARNEEYLQPTLRSILDAARGEIEIVVVLDGYLPAPAIDMQDERVKFVHYEDAIGQRAAINAGAMVAKGKYFLKTDAHSMFDEGFDVKLVADCERDWTVIPRMYNLDVEKWEPKRRKRTDFMWIRSPESKDKPFRHNYWDGNCEKEYPVETNIHKGMAYRKGDVCDVMTGQGACFFMHMDRFWELGGCDEGHGSWGQQGVEVALKAWLSGGSLKVNKKTWFAHWFRGGGGPGFPYKIKGSDQQKARKYSIDLWKNGKWPLQKRPLEWLVKKFAPLPTWEGHTASDNGFRARPIIKIRAGTKTWINKGRVFDVASLHNNRILYANPKKLEGIKILNQTFPVIVKDILAGTMMDDKKRMSYGYYNYLVNRLNPAVRKNGTANAKGRQRCLNLIKELERLCADIRESGLRSPLDMYMDGKHPVLTRGGRRLEIIYQLGWKKVPVRLWRDEWTGKRFIGAADWQPIDDTIHGTAVKQFIAHKEKATDKYWVHNYTPYYDFHMKARQNKHIKILELGVKTGASLDLWHDAFPKAQIYGLDVDPKPQRKEWIDRKRVHTFTGDIYRGSFLNDFAKEHGPFDMIIDDALHTAKANAHCLNLLWQYLDSNGVYAVEDLHPNYKDGVSDTMSKLKGMVDSIWTDHQIQSVNFYPNICFIRRA